MSLANLIMANNQQNANYGIQMANDLSAFGQTVVKSMKDTRDSKTAQSMLPVMQQAMKSFGEGNSAEGYSTLLTLSAADPSNPYLDKLIKVGLIGGQAVDDNRYKTALVNARSAIAGAKVKSGPSGSERLRGGMGIPAMTNGDTGQGDVMTDGTDVIAENAAATTEAEYLSDPQAQADRDLRALQPSDGGNFNQTPAEVPQATEPKYINAEHEAFVPVVQNYMAASPDAKQQVLASATTTEIPKGFEKRSYKGLNEIFPELTGDILIPEVGTVTKIRRTVSTSDAPGSDIKESLAEVDEKTGEERYKFNIETANRIPSAVKAMTNQAPSGQRETFAELFKKNGGVDNAVVSQVPNTDMFQLTFKGNSKDTYNISKGQVEHLQLVQNIPAMAGSGYQFVASEKKEELSAADKVREQFGKPKDDSIKTSAPTTSGIPAAQLPSAPDNPFTKLVEESVARQSTTQKSLNEKSLKTKIADLDQKISSLSGGTLKKASLRPEFLQKQKSDYDRLWAERETLKSELEKLTSSK